MFKFIKAYKDGKVTHVGLVLPQGIIMLTGAVAKTFKASKFLNREIDTSRCLPLSVSEFKARCLAKGSNKFQVGIAANITNHTII